jgi:hypothetical protein
LSNQARPLSKPSQSASTNGIFEPIIAPQKAPSAIPNRCAAGKANARSPRRFKVSAAAIAKIMIPD